MINANIEYTRISSVFRGVDAVVTKSSGLSKSLKKAGRFWPVYLMALPGLVYLLINNYFPMGGLIVAFKKYNAQKGIFGSDWIGFENFKYLFGTRDAWLITRNTLIYNLAFIVIGTICALAIAIVLNDLRDRKTKKLAQSLILLPYLVSWVIVSYLVFAFLGAENGFINNSILAPLGINKITWYSSPQYWPVIMTVAFLWHNVGYNCIVYYASIVGIDKSYYEAAELAGASQWKKILHVTLPCIRTTIITMVMLNIGRVFYSDFGLFYQVPMNTGALFSTTNVVDTYVYRGLLEQGNIGMSAAACLYQSIVGFVLVLAANASVRKFDRDSAFF